MKQKVFGIGLNKTGTTTLGQCLARLGYRHMSCRRDLLIALREGNLETIFNEIDSFDSFEDWPYPLMHRQLFDRYPDARFILTTRSDAATWLRSLKAHSLRTPVAEHCRTLAYGHAYPHGHETDHLAFYEAHKAEVTAFFAQKSASDRLLTVCWETGDEWRKLCGFLGEDVPPEPFPRANAGSSQSVRLSTSIRNRTLAFMHRVRLRSA